MLRDVKVRDLIGNRDRIYFVDADDAGDVAALKLKNFKVRTTGVMQDGKMVGVVGYSDFARKVAVMNKTPSDMKVSDIMSTEIHTVRFDTSFIKCLELMEKHNISHLVILDNDGKYRGMLSWRDLQKRLVKELSYQLKITREYAFGPNVNAKVNDD